MVLELSLPLDFKPSPAPIVRVLPHDQSSRRQGLTLQLHSYRSSEESLWATMVQDMMSGGGSVEDTLELWASSLRDVKGRIRPLFTQDRVAASAGDFLDALLGNEPRKTGWMRAEAAGDPGPWRQQALLGRGRWDGDALRDVVRDYVVEHLAADDAVLVIDETGFLKQGRTSCGVSRQYTGSAGKITNCQIGVFAAYVSPK